MIPEKENELLTQVCAGTPGGRLRHRHPIAASCELDKNPTKRVRVLGEDLVLYRKPIGHCWADRTAVQASPRRHVLRLPAGAGHSLRVSRLAVR